MLSGLDVHAAHRKHQTLVVSVSGSTELNTTVMDRDGKSEAGRDRHIDG